MIGMFDRNNNSTIDFDEFASLWKYIDDWQKCFRSFDKDNSGTIDRNELKQALTAFGKNLLTTHIALKQKLKRFLKLYSLIINELRL